MIILNKKRLLFINLLIVFSIGFYAFKNFDNITLPTSSLPSANHTVVLDAGHGNPDGGAVAADGTIESALNLAIVLKLQSLLEASDCTVILTRSDENGIYASHADTIREQKISDMKNRVAIGNHTNADIFVSIHMNKLEQTQYSGWQTFYKNTDEDSKNLATVIQKNLNDFMAEENHREVKSIKDIYLTRYIEIPLAIVECGFLSNIEETEKLKTDSYQDSLAWSIYVGIMDYFHQKDG